VGRWRDLSVLVTGANGFVGSWVARALVDAGARVVALVRDPLPQGGLRLQDIQDRVTPIAGDLADLALLHRVLAEHEVSLCFHLAAQALVGVADRSPVSTWASNLMGTVNLLEACRLAGTGHVVLASSDKAYGASDKLPYREESPLLGSSPYEASKAGAEMAARSYAATYGLRVAVARCANVYGGGDLNFSRLVPDTMRAVVAGRNPVLRSDGTPRRDYLYASDASAAYLRLGALCLDELAECEMEAFNFGWGLPVSALELVELVIELCGRRELRPEIAGAGLPSREIPDQYLDSRKARMRLSWEPRVQLREGLVRSLDWYRRHLAGSTGEDQISAHHGVPAG
jgi:CDP-glucose 4,6-dehydratase